MDPESSRPAPSSAQSSPAQSSPTQSPIESSTQSSTESSIDEPVALSDLLSGEDLNELVASFARRHRLGIAIVDTAGTFTPRDAPASVRDALAGDADDGRVTAGDEAFQTAALTHDGEPMGAVAIGPYPASDDDADRDAAALAEHVTEVLSVLIHNSYVRYLTSMVHVASMTEAFDEVTAKNQRLERAVVRMQELDRLKSGFLATVSHELRTPLTSVIGYAEMMLENMAGPINAEQREYIGTILHKAEQLLELITGLLDASLIEAGTLEQRSEPIQIAAIVDSVVSAFSAETQQRQIAIEVQRAPLPQVTADSRMVRQVLWQVVANAVKFTPSGGEIRIGMGVGPLRRDGDDSERAIRVTVADSGIGIPPEKLAHIFEPFFQVDSSSTREYGGTGIGLTVAKSHIEAHGGHLWVDSAVGVGSVFTVTLPADDAAQSTAVVPDSDGTAR